MREGPRPCYGGITRMGYDPATNVTNAYGFAHEAPNLAILGLVCHGPTQWRQEPHVRRTQALAWAHGGAFGGRTGTSITSVMWPINVVAWSPQSSVKRRITTEQPNDRRCSELDSSYNSLDGSFHSL